MVTQIQKGVSPVKDGRDTDELLKTQVCLFVFLIIFLLRTISVDLYVYLTFTLEF